MSLIEKIDAEIKELRRIGRELDTKESLENARLITQGMEYAKHIILSEQKVPQEPWVWKTTDVETEFGISRTIERVHITTIGDKIRESNESLAIFAHNRVSCRVCIAERPNCKLDMKQCENAWIDYLNQPYTES